MKTKLGVHLRRVLLRTYMPLVRPTSYKHWRRLIPPVLLFVNYSAGIQERTACLVRTYRSRSTIWYRLSTTHSFSLRLITGQLQLFWFFSVLYNFRFARSATSTTHTSQISNYHRHYFEQPLDFECVHNIWMEFNFVVDGCIILASGTPRIILRTSWRHENHVTNEGNETIC